MKKVLYSILNSIIAIVFIAWALVFLAGATAGFNMYNCTFLFWTALIQLFAGWLLVAKKYKHKSVKLKSFDNVLLNLSKMAICGTTGSLIYSIFADSTGHSFYTIIVISIIIFYLTPNVKKIVASIQTRSSYSKNNVIKKHSQKDTENNLKNTQCPHCEKDIESDSIFCPHCGNKIINK